MKLPLSDSSKEKLKAFARRRSEQVRVAAPPTMRWILNHKAAVVIILLVLYILFPHNSAPQVKGPSITVVASNDSTPATTQPSTQPVTTQFAGDIPLYATGVDGADPQWSKPAELSMADIQTFIQQVNTLANNFNLSVTLEEQYEQIVSKMVDDKIFAIYWNRVIGPGFRDTNLPLDWYELVKDRPIGVYEETLAFSGRIARQTIAYAVTLRFRTTQMRLVGGKLLVGDQLFVKSLQSYVDGRLSRFKKLTPLAQSVEARQAKEFQKEFNPHLDSSGQN